LIILNKIIKGFEVNVDIIDVRDKMKETKLSSVELFAQEFIEEHTLGGEYQAKEELREYYGVETLNIDDITLDLKDYGELKLATTSYEEVKPGLFVTQY
jgi:hypothetical protein